MNAQYTGPTITIPFSQFQEMQEAVSPKWYSEKNYGKLKEQVENMKCCGNCGRYLYLTKKAHISKAQKTYHCQFLTFKGQVEGEAMTLQQKLGLYLDEIKVQISIRKDLIAFTQADLGILEGEKIHFEKLKDSIEKEVKP